MNHFQCLGKTKRGERCKKTFVTSSYSDIITCSLHRNQVATFQYTSISTESKLDVGLAGIIASKMDDPNAFGLFAKLCRATAKACHALQEVKKKQFSKTNDMGIRVLPNGTLFKP